MADRIPLEHSDSIRLLKLLDKPFSSKLHTTLKAVRRSDRPNYTALSYTWGDNRDEKTIVINGRRHPIRKNLWQFLKVLSERREGLWFWVDALCISQTSVEEKNHQISKIDQTFGGADQVYAWLGEEGKIGQILSSISNHTATEVDAACIAESSYWTRTWIIQEGALARRLLLFAGKATCDGALLKKHAELLNGVSSTNQMNMRSIIRLHAVGAVWKPYADLLDVVSRFASSDCFLRHDKIYALQSLANPASRVDVDYNMELSALYWQVITKHPGPCTYQFADNLRLTLDISQYSVANGLSLGADQSWQRKLSIKMDLDKQRLDPLRMERSALDTRALICGAFDLTDMVLRPRDSDSVFFVLPFMSMWKAGQRLKGVLVRRELLQHTRRFGPSHDDWLTGVEIVPGGKILTTPLIFESICSLQTKYDPVAAACTIADDTGWLS